MIIEEIENEFLLIFKYLQQKDLSFCLFFLLNFPADGSFSIGCNILIIIALQNDFRFLVSIGLKRLAALRSENRNFEVIAGTAIILGGDSDKLKVLPENLASFQMMTELVEPVNIPCPQHTIIAF